MKRLRIAATIATVVLVSCGSDTADFETIASFDDAFPGDIISLRSNVGDIEFISRRTGEVLRRGLEPDDITTVLATIDVGTDGEQRGLLGHAVLDGRRFAAWTEPDTLDLKVGEVVDGAIERIVWNGTATDSKAVGGHLEVVDDQLLLGIGSQTDWALRHGSGALVFLDPDGDADQIPVVYSDGWNNPWAFTVANDGSVWVADNAPDGSDRPVAERDGERISDALRTGPDFVDPPPQRAHSAITELADGRLGVCGFLDDEMLAYERVDGGGLERAGTIGRCQASATVLDDGTIVVVSVDNARPVIRTRQPAT